MQDEISRELALRLRQLLQAAQTDSQAVASGAAQSHEPGCNPSLVQAAANFEQLIDVIQSTLQNVQGVSAETPEPNNLQ